MGILSDILPSIYSSQYIVLQQNRTIYFYSLYKCSYQTLTSHIFPRNNLVDHQIYTFLLLLFFSIFAILWNLTYACKSTYIHLESLFHYVLETCDCIKEFYNFKKFFSDSTSFSHVYNMLSIHFQYNAAFW